MRLLTNLTALDWYQLILVGEHWHVCEQLV